MAAAHEQAVKDIVSTQQTYASQHDLPGIFEALTLLVVFKKPANPLEFLAEEARKLKASKDYDPALVSPCEERRTATNGRRCSTDAINTNLSFDAAWEGA
jgi:hypothetical protein